MSEADALQAEMRVRIAKIESEVPVIEASAATLVDGYRTRLQKRIGELLARGGQAGKKINPRTDDCADPDGDQ